MLPILVGVAPMWAAMSWMETGKQAFAKTIGWLAAFLAYKPVAALVMATGSAIMATAGPGDDSQAITLMLTLSVIILLPAMIRVIVPAVQSSVGGGGGGNSKMMNFGKSRARLSTDRDKKVTFARWQVWKKRKRNWRRLLIS